MLEAQQEDKRLAPIIACITMQIQTQCLQDAITYILYHHEWHNYFSEEQYLLAIPKCFCTEILEAVRDDSE